TEHDVVPAVEPLFLVEILDDEAADDLVLGVNDVAAAIQVLRLGMPMEVIDGGLDAVPLVAVVRVDPADYLSRTLPVSPLQCASYTLVRLRSEPDALGISGAV